ncbi:glycoside hydrolase family 27 protein, partial [Pisolithus sp. B1]
NGWALCQCNISEDIVTKDANVMVSLGSATAGYNYVNIDDCYAATQCSSAGHTTANQPEFLSRMRALTDSVHAPGCNAGICGDPGWFTCQLYPGSYQNEERDARLFPDDWGFDYLKCDNCAVLFCNITRQDIMGRYARMVNAISDLSQSTEKPSLVLSLCESGRVRHLPGSASLASSDGKRACDVCAGFTNRDFRKCFCSWASDFYGHNDMDMLETQVKRLDMILSQLHCPSEHTRNPKLTLLPELSIASDQSIEILMSRKIIAINQDPVVGAGVTTFRWDVNSDYISNDTHPAQYCSGESQNGTVTNQIDTLDERATTIFNPTESPWIPAGRQYSVRDLWVHSTKDIAVRNFTANDVPLYGVVALLLQDAGDEPEA